MYALVDCNNFYVSCERAFNPKLENVPVVVLSNNDGCIISRSNEAKKLKIPMGAPFYQWEKYCKQHGVKIFSSNYELYGDMSHRVMRLLHYFFPTVEIYSIDEAFLFLEGFNLAELQSYLIDVGLKIKQYTGIPVGIGLSHTKTLAKIANTVAKNASHGFFYLSLTSKVLSEFPVEKIWGIGRQLTPRLAKLNIFTAKDLKESDPKRIRLCFNVVAEKIVNELRGISCIPLESIQPRKQIISSRSFGKRVTVLEELEEALSHYAAIASLKLRQQKSVTSAIYIFLHTNLFKHDSPQYGNGITLSFITPTADTNVILKRAKQGLHCIYKKGFVYQKAGLILLELQPDNLRQFDLLDGGSLFKSKVTETMDHINARLGKKTVFYCAEGINRSWQLKCDRRSPRYTTQWKELLKIN